MWSKFNSLIDGNTVLGYGILNGILIYKQNPKSGRVVPTDHSNRLKLHGFNMQKCWRKKKKKRSVLKTAEQVPGDRGIDKIKAE